jgi:hypothetical protein
MRTLHTFWLLFLLAVFAVPALAQEDDLFGEEPAKEEAAGDDLFGAPAEDQAPAKEATADQAAPGDQAEMADDSAKENEEDLFDGEATEEPAAKQPAEADVDDKAPRKLHTQEEIKAELQRKNALIAADLTKFIELNKQVAKQAVESGNREELMLVLREYGPAVIRTKQLWTAVVGNPAKYDTWLGSADYWKAWVAFHNSWRSLYGYTDRFAAIDLDLADKITNGLATLGTSFEDYSEWVDEWDSELGNDKYAFARGDDHLGALNQQQMREDEAADDETAEAFDDQVKSEEDETAPSDVAEAREATEEADKKELAEGEQEADAAADKAVEAIDKEEDTAAEGDDLFGEEPAKEKEMPADEGSEEKSPAEEEAPPAKEEAPADDDSGDDLFGAADEEKPATEEAPADEAAADEEASADELFGEAADDKETPKEEESPKESEEDEAANLFGEG